MDDNCRALCDSLASHIVARDFGKAHALLAPWLRATVQPSEIERIVDEARNGLPPPRAWTLGEGMMEVADLREALPTEVTTQNYKGWLCIQFTPGGKLADEGHVCFDLWIAAVDQGGTCSVGYFEAGEAT